LTTRRQKRSDFMLSTSKRDRFVRESLPCSSMDLSASCDGGSGGEEELSAWSSLDASRSFPIFTFSSRHQSLERTRRPLTCRISKRSSLLRPPYHFSTRNTLPKASHQFVKHSLLLLLPSRTSPVPYSSSPPPSFPQSPSLFHHLHPTPTKRRTPHQLLHPLLEPFVPYGHLRRMERVLHHRIAVSFVDPS